VDRTCVFISFQAILYISWLAILVLLADNMLALFDPLIVAFCLLHLKDICAVYRLLRLATHVFQWFTEFVGSLTLASKIQCIKSRYKERKPS